MLMTYIQEYDRRIFVNKLEFFYEITEKKCTTGVNHKLIFEHSYLIPAKKLKQVNSWVDITFGASLWNESSVRQTIAHFMLKLTIRDLFKLIYFFTEVLQMLSTVL